MNDIIMPLLFATCIAFPKLAAMRWRLGYVEAILPPYLACLCFALSFPDRLASAVLVVAVILSGVAAAAVCRRTWDRKPFRVLGAAGRGRRRRS